MDKDDSGHLVQHSFASKITSHQLPTFQPQSHNWFACFSDGITCVFGRLDELIPEINTLYCDGDDGDYSVDEDLEESEEE